MVQVLSKLALFERFKSRPTTVGGWFKSDLFMDERKFQINSKDLNNPPTPVGRDLNLSRSVSFRKDLNYPPTAVGGIKASRPAGYKKAGPEMDPACSISLAELYALTAMYFSIILVIDSLLVAPTTRSTSLPSRKRISVGMPLIP